MTNGVFQIAIDGPVAAGKGTVSRLIAQRLQFLYVDTGAMYRASALIALRANIPFAEEAKIVEEVKKHTIGMHAPTVEEQDGRLTTVLLDGEDVSWKIRTEQVSQGSSIVAAHKNLRAELVRQQQEIAKTQSVVMEGRDITFRVLPDAQLKIFLTATDTERARRRHIELLEKGQDVTFEQIHTDLLERDKRDMERDVDPLHIVPDAWVIDTSTLSIEQVVDLIVEKVHTVEGS
ncbi:(d)CMP kinase [Candidatus Cerribacteria bacterium 'Amazon FNV 2010 28 9']|uniref:Cytidylate kinase n=1 Tax=Candidatus Cerribacteria bacterium 'Amazon FNV 2010 28 9' TaxID=2081795 RepID=A0A317JQT9_9BACT|nr:MAG: (d)CMP kinase [Candidatus Cerribacteria bacterium 'Amazon FNV 2010 28 9']